MDAFVFDFISIYFSETPEIQRQEIVIYPCMKCLFQEVPHLVKPASVIDLLLGVYKVCYEN